MKRIYLLLCLAALLPGCKSDEDNAPSRTVFTYHAADFISDRDTWLVVRAYETGELLDAKMVVDNNPLVFESNKEIPNDRLSISRLMSIDDGTTKLLLADILNQVAVGTVWGPPLPNGIQHIDPPGENGTYMLTISDVPSVYAFALSDKFGGRSDDIQFDEATHTLSGVAKLHDKITEHFVSIDIGTGDPKYILIPDLTDGATIELSYNDFQEFDDVVKITLPENKLTFAYSAESDNGQTNNGYTMYSNSDWGLEHEDKAELNLGFLDLFDTYQVQLLLNNNFGYYRFGSAPTSIEYVSPDKFDVTDRSIDKYAATGTVAYQYRTVEYAYRPGSTSETSIVITYYDPGSGSKHNDPFTPELISQYSIPMESVTYSNSLFYVKGLTYSETLEVFFNYKLEPGDYELGYVIKF